MNALRGKRPDGAVEALHDGADGLIQRSQYDHARGAPQVVAPSVGKVRVERNENASFALTRILNLLVNGCAKSFVVHVVHVPPGKLEAHAGQPRHVLVQLELHGLCRNGYDALVGQFRGVRQRCPNVFLGQRRVLRQNRLGAFAVRQVVEDDMNWNARSPYARCTVHPLGVYPDVCAPIHEAPGKVPGMYTKSGGNVQPFHCTPSRSCGPRVRVQATGRGDSTGLANFRGPGAQMAIVLLAAAVSRFLGATREHLRWCTNVHIMFRDTEWDPLMAALNLSKHGDDA